MNKAIEKVLVTGGLGFIGSYVVDLLVEKNFEVSILDNLDPQVHGATRQLPEYVNRAAEVTVGDVRNKSVLSKAISNVDGVIHLAAVVGVGQSMYQIERYVNANTTGTAALLDILVNKENDVKKLVVASSMAVYGEGKYYCENCGENRFPKLRSEKQLKDKIWDSLCSECGKPLKPLPTDEEKLLMPSYIYAMSKRHQDEMCLLVGETYGIPTVALRFWNTYGPRQSLRNPYTGVCAIFCSRVLNNNPPYIFEDGNQLRDFVHVRDVARATVLALERSSANYRAINVGTGKPISVKETAGLLIKAQGLSKLEPFVSQRYRVGDARHCYPDVTRARDLLGFKPSITLTEGLRELMGWAKTHSWNATDLFDKMLSELEKRKLAGSN